MPRIISDIDRKLARLVGRNVKVSRTVSNKFDPYTNMYIMGMLAEGVDYYSVYAGTGDVGDYAEFEFDPQAVSAVVGNVIYLNFKTC